MGQSKSVAEFIDKLSQFGAAVTDNAPAMTRVAMSTKGEFLKALDRAGIDGTTPVTSKIKVRDEVKGRQDAVAIVRYTGPAHIVNNDMSRHFIGAKRLGTRRGLSERSLGVGAVAAFGGSNRGAFGSFGGRKGAKALNIGGNLRAYAFHPGSKGKRFFQDARKRSETSAPEAFMKAQVREPMKQIFGL